MAFNSNLPADGKQPWGSDMRAAWTALTTFINGLETGLAGKASSADLSSGLAGKVNTATYTSGLAGKADLVDGKVPTSQIPAIALTDFLGTVANQAAMLALTGEKGDWTIRTDTSTTWIITGDTPSALSSWTQIVSPAGGGGGAVSSVNSKTGDVVLAKGDLGLANVDNTSDANKPVSAAQQTALDAKVPTSRTVAGKPLTGNVTLTGADVGLGNVTNTSDANKPVSTAQQAALDAKAAKNSDEGLKAGDILFYWCVGGTQPTRASVTARTDIRVCWQNITSLAAFNTATGYAIPGDMCELAP